MTDTPTVDPKVDPPTERRTLRWLLGGQIVLALLLVGIDLAPSLPGLVSPSEAPALTQPTRPGDQTRRFDPDRTTGPLPGADGDMPRRLLVSEETFDGRPGLLLRGAIAPGDGARIVADLRRQSPGVVALDSPGGSVDDALTIGRMLRADGIDTLVEAGAICLSACPYVFAGGVARSAAENARIGVHQHRFGESTVLPAFLATEDIQRGQAEVLAHLDAMGVDLRIMGPALATPADEIYILTPEELRDWTVVTPIADGADG